MRIDLVSVIIPNYNYARFVKESINSVLTQTYQNIEIVVVNNGSLDDSLEVLNSFGTKIHLIDQANLGQAMARNNGVYNSQGKYIAFLDADDVWESSKIEKQMNLITKRTQLIYSGAKTFSKNSDYATKIMLPTQRGDCSRDFLEFPARSIVLCGESSTLLTRQLFDDLGGFDSSLDSATGWDFFRRASLLTHFDYVGEPLVNYRIHSNNMSLNTARNIENITRAYKKAFAENDVSKEIVCKTTRFLEFSFAKTWLRKYHLVNVLRHLVSSVRGEFRH